MPSTSTYKTVQGDTWDLIALRQLGSEKYMDRLIGLNFEHRHLTVFPSGVVLNLPTITQEIQDQSRLPPWKRSA